MSPPLQPVSQRGDALMTLIHRKPGPTLHYGNFKKTFCPGSAERL